MQTNVFTLPISLEQVAVLIKRMDPQDRQRLLAMVPELVTDAIQQEKMLKNANQTVEELRQKFLEELEGQLLSPDEPFLGGFTLGQYLKLSETERAQLWEESGSIELEELEELEVSPDALPA